MARSISSARWLSWHVADPYVKRAQAQGYRSRSAYKLLEIDRRDRILKAGASVVDLGAAPGGWAQVAAQKVGARGKVIAIDRLEIAPIPGVATLRGDFLDEDTRKALADALGGRKADVILCDLSPDLTGIASTDQARAAELVSTALEFCRAHLEPPGIFLVKVFHGESFGQVLKDLKATFREVHTRKPEASRAESRETYLLARSVKTG
jgi:23S rRNA (uridine2552-2'-O)-methyltransferase